MAVLGLRFCARAYLQLAASGGHSSSRCGGLSLSRPLLLRSTGSRRAGSATVAHGPSRSAACGILPDQGSSPCPLHWQADSQPLRHQGSPMLALNAVNVYKLSLCIFIIYATIFTWENTKTLLSCLWFHCSQVPLVCSKKEDWYNINQSNEDMCGMLERTLFLESRGVPVHLWPAVASQWHLVPLTVGLWASVSS